MCACRYSTLDVSSKVELRLVFWPAHHTPCHVHQSDEKKTGSCYHEVNIMKPQMLISIWISLQEREKDSYPIQRAITETLDSVCVRERKRDTIFNNVKRRIVINLLHILQNRLQAPRWYGILSKEYDHYLNGQKKKKTIVTILATHLKIQENIFPVCHKTECISFLPPLTHWISDESIAQCSKWIKFYITYSVSLLLHPCQSLFVSMPDF